jgi:hypothetical protein
MDVWMDEWVDGRDVSHASARLIDMVKFLVGLLVSHQRGLLFTTQFPWVLQH